MPPGEYKIVVEPSAGSSGPPTRGMNKAKLEEMRGKIAELKTPPTIPIPKKYKERETTDLKANIGKGKQELTLELKD